MCECIRSAGRQPATFIHLGKKTEIAVAESQLGVAPATHSQRIFAAFPVRASGLENACRQGWIALNQQWIGAKRTVDMRTSHYFLIESDRARHDLVLDGDLIASFHTLEEAEAEANRIANRAAPGATLQFGLDMKSTLNDLEIRGATFDADNVSVDTPARDTVS